MVVDGRVDARRLGARCRNPGSSWALNKKLNNQYYLLSKILDYMNKITPLALLPPNNAPQGQGPCGDFKQKKIKIKKSRPPAVADFKNCSPAFRFITSSLLLEMSLDAGLGRALEVQHFN